MLDLYGNVKFDHLSEMVGYVKGGEMSTAVFKKDQTTLSITGPLHREGLDVWIDDPWGFPIFILSAVGFDPLSRLQSLEVESGEDTIVIEDSDSIMDFCFNYLESADSTSVTFQGIDDSMTVTGTVSLLEDEVLLNHALGSVPIFSKGIRNADLISVRPTQPIPITYVWVCQ